MIPLPILSSKNYDKISNGNHEKTPEIKFIRKYLEKKETVSTISPPFLLPVLPPRPRTSANNTRETMNLSISIRKDLPTRKKIKKLFGDPSSPDISGDRGLERNILCQNSMKSGGVTKMYSQVSFKPT